jgi:hypothetical protein
MHINSKFLNFIPNFNFSKNLLFNSPFIIPVKTGILTLKFSRTFANKIPDNFLTFSTEKLKKFRE